LSIFRYGEIVSAAKFNEIVPKEPALGKSLGSLASSTSSEESCGVANRIDWKAPSPCEGENETLKTCSLLHSTVTFLGVISKAEFLVSAGSRAVKLNLKGNFFLSKL